MDKDTNREGLRLPLRYNLIGIDWNSWGLPPSLSFSLSHTLTHSLTVLQAQRAYAETFTSDNN